MKIFLKKLSCIYVGNIYAKRDWGHAKEYVETMWKIVNYKKPDDYVISTGRQESVRKFIELSAMQLGWDKNNKGSGIIWKNQGINEIGIRQDTGKTVIKIDPRYFRPTEVSQLLGDSSKAKEKLGWYSKTSLEELVREMVEFDLNEAKKETLLKSKGFKTRS